MSDRLTSKTCDRDKSRKRGQKRTADTPCHSHATTDRARDWARRDSNPHVHSGQEILSLQRLPFRHSPERAAMIATTRQTCNPAKSFSSTLSTANRMVPRAPVGTGISPMRYTRPMCATHELASHPNRAGEEAAASYGRYLSHLRSLIRLPGMSGSLCRLNHRRWLLGLERVTLPAHLPVMPEVCSRRRPAAAPSCRQVAE